MVMAITSSYPYLPLATVTPAGQYSIDRALGDGVLHNDSQLVHLANQRDREKEDNGGILI